jgi:hypothetical protein
MLARMPRLPVFDGDALNSVLDRTPNRLTNVRTARLADMGLAMRVTQWVGQPAARVVHPAGW